MDGRSASILQRGHLTCHCLLAETQAGLVLVDTGFGTRDVANPQSRLSTSFLFLVKPAFREEMTAIRQIQRLGLQPKDVRHIVLTHLDFDHAGGLDDFPHATVHLMDIERRDARAQKSWLDRQRYRPQQWSTQQKWKTYSPSGGDKWMGFDRVRQLDGLPPEIALVPLPGHTLGHAGVALQSNGKWLLQAGDAYFHRREMDVIAPKCPPGLRFYQWLMEKDRSARLHNQERLRVLKRDHGDDVDIFCGHDVLEFQRLAGRSAEIPPRHLLRVV